MINYNGDLLPASRHFLNHQNRGIRFGDALSDHLRYTGKTILFWEAHYFRLMASMRQLRMEIPMNFTLEHLEAEIQKVLLANNRADSPAMVQLTIFRKSGTALLPDGLEVSFIIETRPLPEVTFEARQQPHVADLFRDYFIQADALARLVHTNRIVQVLGSIYAHENGLDTCLFLNHRKEVSQGLQGNIFLRKGSIIKTPPLDSGCQEGILRKVLLNQDWSERPYELVEAVLSPFELQQADELFLADIENGIQCISQYRKASYTNEAAIYIAGILNGQG